MSKITELVTELSEPIVKRQGCELWDVEFLKEAGRRCLRVSIDNDNGVTLDMCEAVSRELEPLLDELDPIDEPYVLQISSAGAERQLKRPSDFEKFMGSRVLLRLYGSKDGRKEFTGTLTAYNSGDVELDINGKRQGFKKSEIAGVRLRAAF